MIYGVAAARCFIENYKLHAQTSSTRAESLEGEKVLGLMINVSRVQEWGDDDDGTVTETELFFPESRHNGHWQCHCWLTDWRTDLPARLAGWLTVNNLSIIENASLPGPGIGIIASPKRSGSCYRICEWNPRTTLGDVKGFRFLYSDSLLRLFSLWSQCRW